VCVQSPAAGSTVSAGLTLSQAADSRQPTATSPLLRPAQTADSNTACLPSQLPRASLTDNNHVRPANSNIRVPRGIPPPQWGIPARDDTPTAVTSTDASDVDVCDTNPLRRLRNVNTFRPTTTWTQHYK